MKCSALCSNEFQSDLEDPICKTCGKPFCQLHRRLGNHRCEGLLRPLASKIELLWDSFRYVSKANHFLKLIRFQERSRMTDECNKRIKDILREISSPASQSVLCLMEYLWLFEGGYVSGVIDPLCLMIASLDDRFLVAIDSRLDNGYRTPNSVEAIDTLSDLKLSDKFRFLERHGFMGTVRYDFKALRNQIAHQNFALMENGKVLINSVKIEIDWKVTELNSFIAEILGKLTKAFH